MNFRDKKTNKIINLEEVKRRYIEGIKSGSIKYRNFQEYLTDCINKYKTIEIV